MAKGKPGLGTLERRHLPCRHRRVAPWPWPGHTPTPSTPGTDCGAPPGRLSGGDGGASPAQVTATRHADPTLTPRAPERVHAEHRALQPRVATVWHVCFSAVAVGCLLMSDHVRPALRAAGEPLPGRVQTRPRSPGWRPRAWRVLTTHWGTEGLGLLASSSCRNREPLWPWSGR